MDETILQAAPSTVAEALLRVLAGGLAGMYYGVNAIPKEWLKQLARLDSIEELCENFFRALNQHEGVE